MRKVENKAKNGESKRFDVALVHGMRKFTSTAMANARIHSNFQSMFLGHISVNLEVSTYWDNEQSVEEMYQEYVKVLPRLAISEAQRGIYGIEDAKSISTEKELEYANDITELKKQNLRLQEQVERSQYQISQLLNKMNEGSTELVDGRLIQTFTNKQKANIERE